MMMTNPAQALDGGIPSLFHLGRQWPAPVMCIVRRNFAPLTVFITEL